MYAILFKKTNDKNWRGATLSKKGVSLSKLRAFVRKNRRPGYILKIITLAQLKTMIKRKAIKRPKRSVKRKKPMKRKRRIIRRKKRKK